MNMLLVAHSARLVDLGMPDGHVPTRISHHQEHIL